MGRIEDRSPGAIPTGRSHLVGLVGLLRGTTLHSMLTAEWGKQQLKNTDSRREHAADCKKMRVRAMAPMSLS